MNNTGESKVQHAPRQPGYYGTMVNVRASHDPHAGILPALDREEEWAFRSNSRWWYLRS